MLMNVAISIIVPVYNVEKYIERCIESIIGQDFQNWELLLVNDGSTDSSGDLCNIYAAKDKRIKVYHKINGGVSSARNYALDVCSGDYITFLDSDDYLSSNTLSELYSIVKDLKADILDFPYLHFAGNKKLEKLVSSDSTYVYDTMDAISNYWFEIPRFESCARLYKKELIGSIRFDPNLKVGEDTAFFVNYLLRVKRYATTNRGLYMYRFREDSVMNSLSREDIWQNDEKLLNCISKTSIVNTSFYVVLLYRVILSKVRTYNFNYQEIKRYSNFLSLITNRQLLIAKLPVKVRLCVFLMNVFF